MLWSRRRCALFSSCFHVVAMTLSACVGKVCKWTFDFTEAHRIQILSSDSAGVWRVCCPFLCESFKIIKQLKIKTCSSSSTSFLSSCSSSSLHSLFSPCLSLLPPYPYNSIHFLCPASFYCSQLTSLSLSFPLSISPSTAIGVQMTLDMIESRFRAITVQVNTHWMWTNVFTTIKSTETECFLSQSESIIVYLSGV